VLSAFCEDIDDARLELRAAAEELQPIPTLVALEWTHAPALASELDEIRDALARAAASLWPDWYITAEQRFERQRLASAPVAGVIEETANASVHPSASWLREAWRRCAAGKLPLVPRMTAAEQVRQLSRALDPTRLIFALSVASPEATPARVRAVAHAAEWLAYESQAKTLLLLPRAWQKHPELDHVTYQALTLDAEDAVAISAAGAAPVSVQASARTSSNAGEPLHVVVGPIIGKPHPASEAEQLLYRCLIADVELAALFEYNQPITVYGDKRCTVDLIWRAGALVIEVDGNEHRGEAAFSKDRDRDYRVFMSGFTTLRVTNGEVINNTDGVVTKIRSVVKRLQTLATQR
jgi:very-short-patch-repair endonuclease